MYPTSAPLRPRTSPPPWKSIYYILGVMYDVIIITIITSTIIITTITIIIIIIIIITSTITISPSATNCPTKRHSNDCLRSFEADGHEPRRRRNDEVHHCT